MEAQKKLFVLEKDFSYTIEQTSTAGSLFDFVCDNFSLEHISLSLIGRYQVSNASLALAAVGQLSQFGYSFSIKQLLQSLHSAFFPGRFEMVSYLDEKHSQTFQVILDGAHNGAKMRAFIDSLEILYPKLRKIFIVGFKRDKQIDVMLRRIFSVADSVVFTQFSMTSDTLRYASSTASDLLSLSEQIPHPACPVMVSFSVKEALAQAVRMIDPQNCLLVVTGSLYLVGETREFLRPTYP